MGGVEGVAALVQEPGIAGLCFTLQFKATSPDLTLEGGLSPVFLNCHCICAKLCTVTSIVIQFLVCLHLALCARSSSILRPNPEPKP